MPCLISAGHLKGCKDAVGGTRKMFFINYDPALYDGLTKDIDGTVTGFPVGTTAYEWDVERNTTGYVDTITPSLENGTTFFAGLLNTIIHGVTQDNNNEVTAMAQGSPHIVLEQNDGRFLLIGERNGTFVSGPIGYGVSLGDVVGYTLAATTEEAESAPFVTGFLSDPNVTIIPGT